MNLARPVQISGDGDQKGRHLAKKRAAVRCDALEVVELVLEDPRLEAPEPPLNRLPVGPLVLDLDVDPGAGPCHR